MKDLLKIILTSFSITTALINTTFAECDCKCDEREERWRGVSANDIVLYFKTLDIAKHDHEFNGHTFEKHVGKSNDWLDGRLAGSRHEKFVSSYTDLETANSVIKTIIIENEKRIKHWMNDEEKDKLILSKKFEQKIGSAMRKKDKTIQDCNVGVVVLKQPHKTSEKFYVITSYPVVNIGNVESEHKEWKSKNTSKYLMKH